MEEAKAAREYERALVEELGSFDPDKVAGERCCVCARAEGGERGEHCTHSTGTKVVGKFIEKLEAALEASVGSKVIRKGFSRAWYDDEVREAVKERRDAVSRGLQ